MYKSLLALIGILALASAMFYLIITSVLGHEERQAEQDLELQIQAATWRLEL